MLLITTACDRPGCDGTVRFPYEGSERKRRRRLGACDSCSTSYTLHGGKVEPLPDALPTAIAPLPDGIDRPVGEPSVRRPLLGSAAL